MAAVHDRLHQWSATLANAGLAALLRRLWSETGVAARVLARTDSNQAMVVWLLLMIRAVLGMVGPSFGLDYRKKEGK